MKKLLPCLLLIILGLSACRKNSLGPKPVPNPKTDTPAVTVPNDKGIISGKVGPLDLAGQFTVTLINLESYTRDTIAPDADGRFKFSAVPAGNYNITVAALDHADAEITPVKLAAGQSIDLETVTFKSAGFSITGTGSITGSVSPAAGVSDVAVVETTGAHTYYGSIIAYQGTINAGGDFIINNLPEGTFKVYVTAAEHYTGYNSVPDVPLDRGKSFSAGSLLFYDDHDPASPYYTSYELDGVRKYKEKTAGASYSSPQMHLYTQTDIIASLPGAGAPKTVTRDGLEIFLDNVTGPGTYICKGTETSTIRITHREITTLYMSVTTGPLNTWSTIAPGGTGNITITSIDPVKRIINGTFTAALVPETSGTTGNKVIANGAFANYKY